MKRPCCASVICSKIRSCGAILNAVNLHLEAKGIRIANRPASSI
jgi:hypothetical protein